MNISIRWLPAIVSGLLTVLSSAPFDQWYLAYIAFVPLFVATRDDTPFQQGLAFALCCSVIATNWWHSTIIYSFLLFLLVVTILCIAFFVWGYLSAAFRRSGTHPLLALFVPCIIWIGIERILTSKLIGIPCNIGISQSGQPWLIQSASLFGIYATSFLIVLTNIVLAMLVEQIRSRRRPDKSKWMAYSVAILVISLNIGYGLVTLSGDEVEEGQVKVAIVQPVISTDLYLNGWRSPDTRKYIKDTLDELTERAAQTNPDILVWPEGGNGYFNMRIDHLRDFLYKTAIEYETDILVSTNDLDEEGKKYNSIFSISKEGKLVGRYDKVDLILGVEDAYTAGDDYHPIPGSFGLIGPAICYESNFPEPLRKVSSKGAELLFVSTSDAAFKKTSLTINHTRTAVFRAIENNRWVVHASNTGPSVIVSPAGNITASSRFYERGILEGKVSFIQEKSIFTQYGYIVPLLFGLFVIVLILRHAVIGVRKLSGSVRTRKMAASGTMATEEDIELRLKAWLGLVAGKYLPVIAIYSLFLGSIAATSVALAYNMAVHEKPMSYAFKEFFEPIDSLVEDKVTEKFLQAKINSCGPAVMAYIFSYFGNEISEEEIISQVTMTEAGTSMLDLKRVSDNNGFSAQGFKESYTALLEEPLPVIAYINDSHYVVVNKITPSHVYAFDPAIGHVQIVRSVFEQAWNGYLLLVRMQPIKESLTGENGSVQAGTGG